MNREHFFIELKLYLRQLSQSDQQNVIDEYQALFDEKLAEGLTEFEITKELATPKQIAQDILTDFNLPFDIPNTPNQDWVEFSSSGSDNEHDHPYQPSAHYTENSATAFTRFFQVAGIISLNALFMIWAILSWALLLFSGWLVSLTFILSPLISLYLLLQLNSAYSMFQFFMTLVLCGVGLIIFVMLKPLTNGSLKLLNYYTKWNLSVLKGGRHA